MALTAEAGAPVTLRGGGTSMAGNAIGGVVIDASRHVNRILDIDVAARTAIVEPGAVLTDLLAAARPHGLAFGADPSSGSRATLGGMIANNACGAHSVAWGTTADNVRSLDVILADGTRCTVESRGARAELAGRPGREGELHRALQTFVDEHELAIRRRFGRFTRQISGYALHRLLPEHGYDVAGLLCGSEGGFAATLQATLALTPLPSARVLCVLGFADSVASAECVPVVLAHSPLTMESINVDLVDRLPGEVRRAAVDAGLPAGHEPGCWSRWAARTASPPNCPPRRCLPHYVIRARRHRRHWSPTLPRRRCSGGAAQTRPGSRPAAPTVPKRGVAGRMPPFRRNVSPTTCGASTS